MVKNILILAALFLFAGVGTAVAQVEFAFGYNYMWSSQRVIGEGSGVQNSGDGELTFDALALYRPNAKWGFGLNGRFINFTQNTFNSEDLIRRSSVAYLQRLDLAPTVEYKFNKWFSVDAGLGVSFPLSQSTQARSFTEAPTERQFVDVDAASYFFGRAGATVQAGVGFLRLGVVQTLNHDVATQRPLGTPRLSDVPKMRNQAVELTVGLRLGTAAKRYGRAPTVDTLLARALSPLEERFQGWRVSIDPGYGLMFGVGNGDRLVTDNANFWRTALTASYSNNTPWSYRGSLGFQRINYSGFEERQTNQAWRHGITRTNNLEVSAGVERRIWKSFALGIDLGAVVPLSSKFELDFRGQVEDVPARFRASTPTASVHVAAMPYIRYYAGERLALDLRTTMTLTNPYGTDLDNRLPVPAAQKGRFVGVGLGISYALLR